LTERHLPERSLDRKMSFDLKKTTQRSFHRYFLEKGHLTENKI
jgi:hypothetical protein